MIRLLLISLIFVATFAKSQNCADSCRVVCDENPLTRHPNNYMHGKRGQKGEKGERGRDGPQGMSSPSNTELMKNIEERVVKLESFVTNLPMKYKIKICGSGMQDGNIVSDEQITAPSFHSNNVKHHPRTARLFDNNNYGWCPDGSRSPGRLYSNVYIQVDYKKLMTLHGVVTQGNHYYDEWMTSYRVKYAYESGQSFVDAMDSSGQNPKLFAGNTDRSTPKINRFEQPITAQIFRIYPISWHSYPTTRFDFITC